MSKEKSLVEEALIQMKTLEEAVSENAKGILASTMKKEIKDLVKESLSEQDDEIEQTDMEFDDEESEDEIDDTEEEDVEDDIEDDEFDDEELDDDSEEPVIDLRNETNPENVLRVFKLMGPEDQIVVTKDESGHINVKDNETNKEYMIVSESEDEFYEDDLESQEMYEFDDESEEDYDDEELKGIIDDVFSESDNDELVYEIEFDDEEEEESYELDEEEEESYELDEEEDEEESYDLDEVMESFKAKGTGMGKPKFKYDSKPNQGQGFKTKMKQGPKSVGTGKAKFTYKDGENLDGEFKVKPKGKKAETKEGVRTLGAGSKAGRKGGLPKPRAGSSFNSALKENTNQKELQILREKNEEYRNALNVFRNKLNEVAVFNSNLAYATRLFTEHTTSKQEKINILKRFDNVETIKESKNLYQSIKEELNTKVSKPINESIERTITNTPSNGSSVNLIESKTYENPQFMRMKDLMSKIK